MKKAKQQTFVFKVDSETQNEMEHFYKDFMREKKPPYSKFQAMSGDSVVTLYESGKVMFQGISADIDANIWKERQNKLLKDKYGEDTANKMIQEEALKEKKKNKTTNALNKSDFKDEKALKAHYSAINTIGSDEVGTGAYFGPVVVTASYVNKSNIDYLKELGVNDSKKLTDDKIIEIAPELIKKVSHTTFILTPDKYNETTYNMNQIKAILHNKVLVSEAEKHDDVKEFVVDQFELPKTYYTHIAPASKKISKVTFMTKSESIVPSIAVSSVICRYIFLLEINKLSKEVGFSLPTGADSKTDEAIKKIIKEKGLDALKHYGKLKFANTNKVLNEIGAN